MTNYEIFIGLAALYISSVIGVAAKFWHSGVRGIKLWHCLWTPLVMIIFPISMLLTIYVPGFNKRAYFSILNIRRTAKIRLGFSVWVVISSIQAIPVFTSIMATIICENQGESLNEKSNTWARTTDRIAPYMALKFGHFMVNKAS